jgi:GH25 family lysozyme M1 (1,4-beta-N-acetylmuramidase)
MPDPAMGESRIVQRLVVAVAVPLVVLAGNGTASAAEATRPGVTGIDVSHWQDAIDWPSVARSGVRFAIAKATEGQTFTDPRYAENKNGAESAGLAFTAYHFAQPDRAPGDAVSEADHFLDVADLSSGNLLPVLDIERTGGLTPRELVAWARTWLARVQARLGVRAVVYTNPAFWHTAMANSTWFARAGSPLWIATTVGQRPTFRRTTGPAVVGRTGKTRTAVLCVALPGAST